MIEKKMFELFLKKRNKLCLGGTGGRIIFVKFNGGLLLLFKKLGCGLF
jgi:hypothetical protein